ncbi:Phosphate starvation-inducible protein PhoH, predicted ATPase [hydrothermal vent metagenome]|uniref:PhoH-like protein n=1 Tax=hydrothermal vent metagenome TaxID=652676 RepID=A0A3B1BI14_9ZZZZ
MNTSATSLEIVLKPADNQRLANLCGQFDEHLHQIETRLGVEVNNRGNHFRVIGEQRSVHKAEEILLDLYSVTAKEILDPIQVNLYLQDAGVDALVADITPKDDVIIRTLRGNVRGRGLTQQQYLRYIKEHDVNFGIGPAGTGKTYLAVASAVDALEREQVRRIILTRPAVESGERLGFLPGDIAQKIDPYLRPLYDALYEMMGFEQVAKLIERNVIEVAPLAYMRGRTLNESFIILDEAQNTSVEQMKMFLTRIGFGSCVVVTGDVTQVDLPRSQRSGLRHVVDVLADVDGISFSFFKPQDVVRHKIVQRIVKAYDKSEQQEQQAE